MYLKSLELQGFKSFPDRTLIRFSDGMTAIVGPNGSGKSNISDAIRWVLGEQSTKSLRGAKMEDVIFGGTKARKPMGFAQVTLILDNSVGQFPVDAAEVMVTRRFYRSGESEYYLNKKRVRLKDIREVFMDTGLGRDGYSIIGQGRIDEILSVKSADRRDVFEEAAGVTRFRTRKEEAEHRLTQTEDNLVRIRDIWNALNERFEPLQKQAETAKEYLKLRDRLRVREVSLWMHTLDGMKEAIAAGEQALETAQADVRTAKAEQQQHDARLEQLAQEIRSCDVQADELRRTLSDIQQQQAQYRQQRAVLQESRKNAGDNIVQAKAQIAAQEQQAQAISSQMEGRKARLKELEQQQPQHKQALAQVEEEIADLAARLNGSDADALREKAEQSRRALYETQAQRQAAQARLDTMRERRDTIDADSAASAQKLQAARDEQQAMAQQLAQLETQCADAERALNTARQGEADSSRALEEARRAYAAAQNALTDTRNRIRMLTELQKDYEGFSRAVKFVMNRAAEGELRGVRGPVSSLISVDDAYVTAIETALGAAASNIIVETPEDGKRAIEQLRRRDGGRATFLPMDTIRPMQLRESGFEAIPGVCGVAAELVQCPAEYRDIVKNLLGRTVIVQDMDCALRVAKQYRNRFRIVTRDGQVIAPGGAMTGGSISRSAGILSRANQLIHLKEQEQRQAQQQEQHAARGTELAEQAQQAEQAVRQAQESLTALGEQRAAREAECRQHQELLDSLERANQQLLQEKNDAQAVRGELKAEIAVLDEQLGDVRQRQEELTRRMAGAEQEQRELSQQLAACTERAAELRTRQAQAAAETESQRQALRDLQILKDNAETSAAAQQAQIAVFARTVEEAEAQMKALQQQEQAAEQRLEQQRDALTRCGQHRLHLEQNQTEENTRVRALADQIVALEREAARAEAAAQRIRSEEQQILDKMWDSYELTPTAAHSVAEEVRDEPEEQKEAAKLRTAIRRLGPVNLGAVEEFQKLSERLTFLTEQKNDLERAEGELRTIIARLTEQMKEVFAAAFAELNHHFGETFVEMFGGGSAELVLEDEQDILHCGIEIRVTPPGKTVRSLSLLSGGEKAFVAIALYFAILKVRPTPFCVLDEIEAALDDVNVTRYARYLRRFGDKTQFIVITHRRGTMEEADMLYGVTMQEKGVSKLLMLNIAEVEKELNLSE